MIPHILTTPSTDACSYYRSLGPLGRMRQLGLIDLTISSEIDWTRISQVDLVFIQRPDQEWHRSLIKLARKWSVPVWVDLDDNMFSVPNDNPAAPYLMNSKTQGIIKECLSMASVISSSTEHLSGVLKDKGYSSKVIPNALDPRFKIPTHKEQSKTILWRGSPTHDRDLSTYGDAIIKAAQANPGWRWHFQGYNPWRITEPLSTYGEVTWALSKQIEDYMEFIADLKPAIMIVPLHESEFNRSKSNIAWIEGTYAGAATLAPNWPEWDKPGVYPYNDSRSFADRLKQMMGHGHIAANYISTEYIQEHLMLDHVNKQRLDLIMEAVKIGTCLPIHAESPLS